MKITIEPTEKLVHLAELRAHVGPPSDELALARLWEGVTDQGTRCKVFVLSVAVPEDEDQEQFTAELEALPGPTRVFSMRQVL